MHGYPDRRYRRRYSSLLAAADVSCGQSGCACARDHVRWRRRATLAGTDLEGPLAVSRHVTRSRQRRTRGPDRGRAVCRPFPGRIRPAAVDGDDSGLRRGKRVVTSKLSGPQVSRLASGRAGKYGRGAEPPGGERQNDERGGLSDPWPAAGGGARRNRPGAPFAHEETASRPRGVDVPRRPCKRGQGYSASHASQLTPVPLSNATNRELLLLSAPADAPLPPAVVRRGRSFTPAVLTPKS